MVRPTLPFTPQDWAFDSVLDGEERRATRSPATVHRSPQPPHQPRQPLRRYCKGGTARRTHTRPPPEYVRDIQDTGHRVPPVSPITSTDGSEAGSENGGGYIAELPVINSHSHAQPRPPAASEPEAFGHAVTADLSVLAAQPEHERSMRRGIASRGPEPQTRQEHARMMAEVAYQATLGDSQPGPWDQRCLDCVASRRCEALLRSYIVDQDSRMEELEERFARLRRATGALIDYLKRQGFQ